MSKHHSPNHRPNQCYNHRRFANTQKEKTHIHLYLYRRVIAIQFVLE